MKVYHGSLEKVYSPEIRKPNRTLDYGLGFYTTTDFDQACRWVERRKSEGINFGYVNEYEVDDVRLRTAKVLWFDRPSEDWVDFVYNNRNVKGFNHDYDFVYGPVANDRVYAAFALFESGILSKQDLIRELKTYKLVDQLLFHTDKALESLCFVDAIKIDI